MNEYPLSDEKFTCTCPACRQTIKIHCRLRPSPKWPYVLGFIMMLAGILCLNNGRGGAPPAKTPVSSTAKISGDVLSYLSAANTDPSCDVCIDSAKKELSRRIEEAEMKRTENMALMPAGEYLTGSMPGEGDADEYPRKNILLDSFHIDKYEVTNSQYIKFTEETSAHYPEWMKPGSKFNFRTGNDPYYRKHGENLRLPEAPIVGVNWEDADAYCRWRNKRLPTEAEWEAAARGGTVSKYFFGENETTAGEYAWLDDNSGATFHPAGLKKPNQYGIYDTLGNVWEWVSDFYDKNYYSLRPSRYPKGPETGTAKVIRGGSWAFDADSGRPGNRASLHQAKANDDIGFRCAADIKLRKQP